jgi:hypothetical protein
MTVPYDSQLMIAYFDNTQTYRYFYLTINDPTNVNGYLAIGRLYLCLRATYASEPRLNFSHDIDDSTIVSRSITQQTYADLGTQTNIYTLAWGLVTDTTKQSIQTIYRTMGQWNPVIVIPSPANISKLPPIYATMMQGIGFTIQAGWLWQDSGSSSSSGGLVFKETK